MTDGPKRRRRNPNGDAVSNSFGTSENKAPKTQKGKKLIRVFLRLLAIVVLFVITSVGVLFFMDKCSDDGSVEPEIITVAVLGDEIELHDGRRLTYNEFEAYIEELDAGGDLVTVALITDSANSPDVKLYNRVVRLLRSYGISCEELPDSATLDEATPDQSA